MNPFKRYGDHRWRPFPGVEINFSNAHDADISEDISEEYLYSRIAQIVCDNDLESGEMSSDTCLEVTDTMRQYLFAQYDSVRFSMDRRLNDAGDWWIEASTDASTSLREQHSVNEGLFGWMLSARRPLLYESKHENLPINISYLPGYERTESVLLVEVRIDSRIVGCLCAVSDAPDAIDSRLRSLLIRTSRLIEALAAPIPIYLGVSRDAQGADQTSPTPRTFQDVLRELTRSLAPRYEWFNYWQWKPRNQTLIPHQLAPSLVSLAAPHLTALGLGEGFVGSVAERLEAIRDNKVLDAYGEDTRIATPLPDIAPGIQLRAILAVPVMSSTRFYGVLAILGDATSFFNDHDLHTVQDLANMAGPQLAAIDERDVTDLERSISEDLLTCIARQLRPSEYWSNLSRMFERICSTHVALSISILVGRRHAPHFYSLKASSMPHNSYAGIQFDARKDPFIRALATRRTDWVDLGTLPADRSRRQCVHPNASKVGVAHFPSAPSRPLRIIRSSLGKSAFPVLIATIGLEDSTMYSSSWPVDLIRPALDRIIENVFAITRAILTAADVKEAAQLRAMLMTIETHDTKGQLNKIAQSAEGIHLHSDGENRERARDIMNAVYDLRNKTENSLFASFYSRPAGDMTESQDVEFLDSRTELDIRDLLAEVVRLQSEREPNQVIVLELRWGEAVHPQVFGLRRWLVAAVRNVLSNAVKFGRGLPITVEASLNMVESHVDQGEVTVRIIDRGIGIPESEHKKIFVAGHQNAYSRRFEVTGSQIALSVSREILELHGGSIWVQSSSPGNGAIFAIKLPVAITHSSEGK
ncbi:MAG: hypothetical protein IT332_01765 [Ardenticatenales bacterium]|nr:hypothetical protein [Ardenticatenales bacterium]